ncbi:MAG: hypothetical protein KTR32_15825 [Granulosicoccus sp.]|nr:hypothetical protein [Granulosicoccus sp.]
MTIARRQKICLESTPYYLCTNHCVRRTYLSGDDPLTKKNFDHRRNWIKELLWKLEQAFCISVITYTIGRDHYHVVVKIDTDQATKLSDLEVIDRWGQIYSIPSAATYYKAGYNLTEAQSQKLMTDITHWRLQLTSLSRFIGHLNEKLARQANKEDKRTGRFWKSRFECEAVDDLSGLLGGRNDLETNLSRV